MGIKKKYDDIKKNNSKLMTAAKNAGAGFEDENTDLKTVHETNEKLLDDLENTKDKNRDLKADCGEKQKEYMSVAESRLEYQKTMARISTLIQDNCKDNQLIEDAQGIALDCEAESKAIMAELEAEHAVP